MDMWWAIFVLRHRFVGFFVSLHTTIVVLHAKDHKYEYYYTLFSCCLFVGGFGLISTIAIKLSNLGWGEWQDI